MVQLQPANHVHHLDACNDDASTPKRLDLQNRSAYPFDRPVVQIDNVVEVTSLTHQHINADVGFHAFNRRSVGAALVDGDFL